MTALLTVVGLLVIVATGYDAAVTTVSPTSGGGPLTRVLLGLAGRLGRRHHTRRLLAPGVGLLVGTVITWTALLWVGWTLVLGASPGAVASSSTGLPADTAARWYYAGFTVVTLGTGDYVPVGAWSQVASVLAAFSGLFLVTLSITYLLNVVTAVVDQRSLATTVSLLGDGAHDTVQRWHRRPGGADSLDEQLGQLAPQVVRLAQQHLAYPVLHRFAGTAAQRSAPVALAVLCDVLQLLEDGHPDDGPAPGEEMLGRALDVYVHELVRERGHGESPGTGGRRHRREHLADLLDAVGQTWPATGGPERG